MELIQRAIRGDLAGVETLIQKGVSVNTKNRCNQTALYFACEKGHTNVVQYLLDGGASVSLGAKPLIAAVRNNHYECAELLLQHHATVHCTNTNGESPMTVAVQKRHYSIMLLLLQYGTSPVLLGVGEVALQLLKHAKLEHAKVVQKLIDLNVIKLTSENIFLAAFGFAFRRGSLELAERMLSNHSYPKVDQLYPDAAYYSAKNNWPTLLSKLFEKGVNINALTDGHTPLYAACKEGHETVVTLLLNNGADPNVKNELRAAALRDFSFPLQAAVQRGNAVIFNMLLQKGAKLDQPEEPLLHTACSTATIERKTDEAAETKSAEKTLSIVTLLLQQGVNINAVSDKGDTALYRACASQQLEVVQSLLKAGADVNLTSNRCYPLIAACDSGNVKLIRLLVSAGADVKCSNSSNETCLHVLIDAYSPTTDSQKHAVGDSKEDVVNVVKTLLEVGADVNAVSLQKETALYQASNAGHEDIVRLLLAAGAETNGSSTHRPLYAACEHDYIEIVDLLLQFGADSNVSQIPKSSFLRIEKTARVVSSSSLPICCAVMKGCEDIVKLLLKHGADVNKKDQNGKSALIYVVKLFTSQRCEPPHVLNPLPEEMHLAIFKSVLLAGGDVTVSFGYDDLSPLHIASSVGMCDVIMELMQRGANCNQLTSKGASALDLACKNGHEAALELLLKNGAKPDGKTVSTPPYSNMRSYYESHSMPPLCTAAKDGSEVMVKMLLNHGANVNASNKKGDTALHLATSNTVIATLLNAGANVNARNDDGETALSVVCEKRQADANVVELLLKFGADPNIRFLLHNACTKNDTDTVKLLVAYGADANIVKESTYSSFVMKNMFPLIEPSPLCIACRNGNVAIVEFLLKTGANVAFADRNGSTALHIAIDREKHVQQVNSDNSEEFDPIVTLLLQRDAPVNVVSDKGETPLYMACKKGLAGVVKQLLDCRADVGFTTRNSNKYSLLIACEKKFRDIAVMLLDRGANTNVNKDFETPLKFASANGDAELVKKLIHHGADVNQMQNISDTALHVAVVQCKGVENKAFVNIVQRLLTSRAGPNALNQKHETPLYLACRPTHDDVNLDIVQALLKHGADPNACPLSGRRKSLSLSSYYMYDVDEVLPPLSAASRCGNTALVILLIKYGATVDHRTELGRTPLHYAIDIDSDRFTGHLESSKRNTSTVKILLSSGADANVMDETGASPLYLACERGKREIVELLLSHSANPNVKGTNKYPMHAACRRQHYDLVTLLLECEADISVRDQHGKTALHCVLESRYHHCSQSADETILGPVQLLLDGGADVNIMSEYGETAFYVACSMGLTSIVAKMLVYGAKVNGISGKKPPLVVACRNKHVSVVQLLLSNGANPDVLEAEEDECGLALPLHIAAANGSIEIVELLLKHGSDVNITDADGNTALYDGIEHSYRTATLRYSDKIKATSNAKSVVDILLENRADVNILNKCGETPLYRAVSMGLLDVVSKMLQTYGGNPNTPSPYKNTLVAACEKRNVELVDVLLKNGADPNLASERHQYSSSICRLPLCVAVKQGTSDEIITLLIKAGASVNATDRECKTALCIATEIMTNRYGYPSAYNKLSTIRLLLEHGADLNVLMPNGRSLLHVVVSTIATTKGREHQTHFIELLQLMVKHGAILSDSFSHLAQHASHESQRVLKDLATFSGRHEFIVDLFRVGTGLQLIAKCCNSVATRPGEVTSIRLCQAAVLAGYTPSVAELQSLQLAAASEHAGGVLLGQLVNWLNEDRQRVPSLLRQCRVVIRRQLSSAVQHRSILTSINELPLPNILKRYLQFEGTLTEVDLSVNKEPCGEESSTENRHQLASQ